MKEPGTKARECFPDVREHCLGTLELTSSRAQPVDGGRDVRVGQYCGAGEVIQSISEAGCAIGGLAIAYRLNDTVSEELPMAEKFDARKLFDTIGVDASDLLPTLEECTWYQTIRDTIARNLGESWEDFVRRSRLHADKKQGEFWEGLRKAKGSILPEGSEALCRLSWYTENGWRERFGRNLIQLVDCEPDEPISGLDINGIKYLFGPCAEDYRDGRRLFDEAERLCAHADKLQHRLSRFLDAELQKEGDTEHGTFKIVAFAVGYDDWEMMRTFAYLGQVEGEPDYLLWGDWKVEMEDLEPTRYCGFFSTTSRPFMEPGED